MITNKTKIPNSYLKHWLVTEETHTKPKDALIRSMAHELLSLRELVPKFKNFCENADILFEEHDPNCGTIHIEDFARKCDCGYSDYWEMKEALLRLE